MHTHLPKRQTTKKAAVNRECREMLLFLGTTICEIWKYGKWDTAPILRLSIALVDVALSRMRMHFRFKVNFGVSVNFGAVNLVFVAKTATFKFKRVFSRNVAFILLAEISISHGETSRAWYFAQFTSELDCTPNYFIAWKFRGFAVDLKNLNREIKMPRNAILPKKNREIKWPQNFHAAKVWKYLSDLWKMGSE